MKFRWEGFDKSGTVKRGYVDADNDGLAAEKLRHEMGIMVQKCEPDGPEPMKTVLPGGDTLTRGKAKSDSELNSGDLIGQLYSNQPKKGDELKSQEQPKKWQADLEKELKAAQEVTSYAFQEGWLPTKEMKAEVTWELMKDALKMAVIAASQEK
jgi:hypothetical protein